MARVQLQNISKKYGSHAIIEDLSLDISDGEFVVLVGASGCGKSTTLRMIAGLETLSAGSILIGDTDVTWVEPNLRNCAMVFQNYALFPQMTVAENMGYGLKLRGMPRAVRDAAVSKAADTLGLTQLLDRLPKELSGGQRQRVAIGRAIVRQPAVFLFDEPLSNLDAKLRVEMRAEIKELHQRLGTTIVYVTHDQVEAMTLADRVVVMNKGKISQAADPMTLYRSPANTFIAGFIGTPGMNLFPALAEERDGRLFLDLENGIRLPVYSQQAFSSAIANGKRYCLGLRPNNFAQSETGTEFRIRTVEPLGSHHIVHGQFGSTSAVIELPSNIEVKAGGSIRLMPLTEQMHLFHFEDGTRVL